LPGDAQTIVMAGTAMTGGIASVIDGYVRDGLVQRWNIEVLATHDRHERARRFASAMGSLGAMLVAGRVSILHCHVATRGSFWRKALLSEMARLRGVPVIFHLHGAETRAFYERQTRAVKHLFARELESAAAVIVLSESWREFAVSIAPRANVRVIPNYVALPTLDDTARSVSALFLGELIPRKGVFDLLPAFKTVRATIADTRLELCGVGELERVRALLSSLHIEDSVEMPGWVSGVEKARRLRHAGVYVLPSYNEGLPMSILEAMSYGMPIVSTRVGGIPELVRHGLDGYLVEPGDVGGLASAMTEILSDPELRRRMGASARRRIETTYSRDVVLPKLEQLYAELTTR
jgi:glycosyltransferase involved in cell wall biosynthesis